MKKILICSMAMVLVLLSTACSQNPTEENNQEDIQENVQEESQEENEQDLPEDNSEKIDFEDNKLYAVAYLGYSGDAYLDNLEIYLNKYEIADDIPMHYFSEGEYYLIIPRYEDTVMKLYENDMETMGSVMKYEEEKTRPFIVQCNISDIFSDVTISLTHDDKEVSFSPYISLKDGSVEVGDLGKNITE